MKLKIFCRCSLFPSWLGEGLISTPVKMDVVSAQSYSQTKCVIDHMEWVFWPSEIVPEFHCF